ncbi:hypothetical protein EI555_004506 [Monodon monoceros]|uniref:DIX domain-containing protein n=1 Tax=Monodon monoceros TaxID=40151 RepID=A0A4V5PB93_MONMO|nr:hypothetical protein EI555_004506 [Monodon monoceros]
MAVLTHPLFLSVCILAFPMYLLDFLGLWNRICKKSLPYFLARFTVMYNEQMASKKQGLLSNLQEFAGPSGKLSLLELGCSTGPNFKFYPPGCRVTCIDPNPNFEKFLIKSIAENRHLQFEHFLVAAGEDVVVCTLVLCSVKNQEQMLQDVCRVLRPESIQSRLDQSMEENQDLKKELLKYKQEARNFQGVKDALQQRLTQQDTSALQLRQELLRANMDEDELHNQNVDLQRKLDERDRLSGEYKKELGQKDRLLKLYQAKLEEALWKLSEAIYQQVDLKRELEHKDVPLTHCVKRGRGVAGKGAASVTHRGSSDLQLVRDALCSLRNSFSGHDPQHHTIDSLEQGISGLTERPRAMETQRRQDRRVRGKSPRTQAGSGCRESWPPHSKLPHSQSSPAVSSACTKVLYFTGRPLTPFMVNIPKRVGEVTLKDLKAGVDREGNHRYHVKALDPEFGTVKEEAFHDDDAIPGWEGKIVAWL